MSAAGARGQSPVTAEALPLPRISPAPDHSRPIVAWSRCGKRIPPRRPSAARLPRWAAAEIAVGIVVALAVRLRSFCPGASARVPPRLIEAAVGVAADASNGNSGAVGFDLLAFWINRLARPSPGRAGSKEAIEDVGGEFRLERSLSVSSIRSRNATAVMGVRTAS